MTLKWTSNINLLSLKDHFKAPITIRRSFALANAKEGQLSIGPEGDAEDAVEDIFANLWRFVGKEGSRGKSHHQTHLANPHFALLEQLVYAKNCSLELAKVTDGQLGAVSQLLKVGSRYSPVTLFALLIRKLSFEGLIYTIVELSYPTLWLSLKRDHTAVYKRCLVPHPLLPRLRADDGTVFCSQ